jgi:hypothetical protein
VAGTTLLLVVAGLFIRALGKAGSIDIGFSPANVQALSFQLEVRYPDETQAPALVERLEAGARALPWRRQCGNRAEGAAHVLAS